jgi:hypothetical protein
LIMAICILKVASLAIKVGWSTMSNALVKSMKKTQQNGLSQACVNFKVFQCTGSWAVGLMVLMHTYLKNECKTHDCIDCIDGCFAIFFRNEWLRSCDSESSCYFLNQTNNSGVVEVVLVLMEKSWKHHDSFVTWLHFAGFPVVKHRKMTDSVKYLFHSVQFIKTVKLKWILQKTGRSTMFLVQKDHFESFLTYNNITHLQWSYG